MLKRNGPTLAFSGFSSHQRRSGGTRSGGALTRGFLHFAEGVDDLHPHGADRGQEAADEAHDDRQEGALEQHPGAEVEREDDFGERAGFIVPVWMPPREVDASAPRQPSTAPSRHSTSDSSRNAVRMLKRPKPRARSVPISRAREAMAPYIVLATANIAPIVRKNAIMLPTILMRPLCCGLLGEVVLLGDAP